MSTDPGGRVVYDIGVQSLTAGSNPSKDMDVGLLCCVLSTQRLLRRADHSLRGVHRLFVCVISCDLQTSTLKRLKTELGCYATETDKLLSTGKQQLC